jgi:hypothetical protein
MQKQPLRPDRLRQVPAQFSWVDHRLVREGHLRRATPDGLALYLFLVTVSDAQGLSYYSDTRCAQHLGMDIPALHAARRSLIEAGLIAYVRPLYQVLSLDRVVMPDLPRSGEARSLAQILAKMGEVKHD